MVKVFCYISVIYNVPCQYVLSMNNKEKVRYEEKVVGQFNLSNYPLAPPFGTATDGDVRLSPVKYCNITLLHMIS